MKPPAFQYYQPHTLDEALQLLSEHGDAKILAGGQSLIPMMNMRLAHPDVLIDINGLTELTHIKETDQGLAIGALVRHYQLEQHPLIQRKVPLVAEAEHLIGHPAIRSRGTIGGSLSHADPAAELPVLATLFDWELVVSSAAAERTIPAREFFLSYFITALAPDEMVTGVRTPSHAHAGAHITEYAVRAGDFALAIAAASIVLNASDTIQSARIALGGVADIPWRDPDFEASLQGQSPSPSLWREVGQHIKEAIDPTDDLHASADYRRQLAQTLVEKALAGALERAKLAEMKGRQA